LLEARPSQTITLDPTKPFHSPIDGLAKSAVTDSRPQSAESFSQLTSGVLHLDFLFTKKLLGDTNKP